MKVLQRGLRSVPGCGELWARYIRFLVRYYVPFSFPTNTLHLYFFTTHSYVPSILHSLQEEYEMLDIGVLEPVSGMLLPFSRPSRFPP